MTRTHQRIAVGLLLCMIAVFTWAVTRHRAAGQPQPERETAEAPLKVSVEQGKTVLTLGHDTQVRLGIEAAPLESAENYEQVRATALVLSAQDLAGLGGAYATAEANATKAQAGLEVAQHEYNRLKLLNQENQNASLKALQAVEGTQRSAQAEATAADQQLRLQRAVIAQRWGPVVAHWLVSGAPTFQQVIEQRDWLVQVTLPADSNVRAPSRISLQLPGGSAIAGSLVSAYPRVDPRIQGANFLYIAPAHAGLAAGLNLLAELPVGPVLHGVIVPESAVVWWQGQAWAYVHTAQDTFVRQPVATDMPVHGGWFVALGFSPNDKVVIRGAEALFSGEIQPPAGAAAGDEGDND
jgi:multidrug efflux system membrane fusion protein